jgi:hypothetical protein
MNKEDLLKTGFFKNNNFLNKYLELFSEPITEHFEKHHIIPRSYYKIIKSEVDNSKKNLKNISLKNHYLAHYYLTKCTTGTLKKLVNYYFSKINSKLAHVAFELNAQIYEQVRLNDRQNFLNYIKTAHNNIDNYNKKFPKRPPEHSQHIKDGMRNYWKRRKREEALKDLPPI